jgi:hypothetical protein
MKLILILVAGLSVATAAAGAPARLRYSLEFILGEVLAAKRLVARSDMPLPALHLESRTPLAVFQDAIEPQWGFRPHVIINAFSARHNAIFLSDEPTYYARFNRCIDDSLAHELVHYVQSKYQDRDLNDDALEAEAIEIQKEFRGRFCP